MRSVQIVQSGSQFEASLKVFKAMHRKVEPIGHAYARREASETYMSQCAGEIDERRLENTGAWEIHIETSER
jgi:hypothetical protein